jgi:Zn finger protein HypA/HybF involved in hydrogenase expression
MAIVTVPVQMFECDRCSHRWSLKQGQSKLDMPRLCPRCKSVRWNDDIAKKNGHRGRLKADG